MIWIAGGIGFLLGLAVSVLLPLAAILNSILRLRYPASQNEDYGVQYAEGDDVVLRMPRAVFERQMQGFSTQDAATLRDHLQT